LTYNAGAAFSIGTDYTWLLTGFTAVAVVVISLVARRAARRSWAIALALILGGATTHLLDRLFREPGPARGRVVDFIDYAGFFVGNVADIALVAGVALAVLLQLRGVGLTAPAPPPAATVDAGAPQ
jgi:signal peptidase II